MIYTDNIHMVADTLDELHSFAKDIGLSRSYFEGVRRRHPHYDLMGKWKNIAIENGAKIISKKQLLIISKTL